MQQGKRLGALRTAQEMVLATIEARLGAVPDTIRNAIAHSTDVAYLQMVNIKIIKASDPDAVIKEEFMNM